MAGTLRRTGSLRARGSLRPSSGKTTELAQVSSVVRRNSSSVGTPGLRVMVDGVKPFSVTWMRTTPGSAGTGACAACVVLRSPAEFRAVAAEEREMRAAPNPNKPARKRKSLILKEEAEAEGDSEGGG